MMKFSLWFLAVLVLLTTEVVSADTALGGIMNAAASVANYAVSMTAPAPAPRVLETRTPAPIATRPPRTPWPTPAPTPGPVDEQATPAPIQRQTAAPVACPDTLPGTPDEVCPSSAPSIVAPLSSFAQQNPLPAEIFYDMSFGGTSEAPTVLFKIDNPFDELSDIYVQYGDTSPLCTKSVDVETCDAAAPAVEVPCTLRGSGWSAVVTVYFESTDTQIAPSDQTVTQCCYPEDRDATWNAVAYTYLIQCACPPAASRNLRGGQE